MKNQGIILVPQFDLQHFENNQEVTLTVYTQHRTKKKPMGKVTIFAVYKSYMIVTFPDGRQEEITAERVYSGKVDITL